MKKIKNKKKLKSKCLLKEKILCVLLDNNKKYFRWNSKKPFAGFEFNISYATFAKIGKNFGVKVIFSKYTDYSNGFVKKNWFFDNNWKKSYKKIKPDLFYDKFPITKKGLKIKKELSKKKILFNDFKIDLICKDKFVQSKIFRELSPKTILIKNNVDFFRAIKKFSNEKVILKPRSGLGSKGIKIFDFGKKIKKQNFFEEYILQEFIDTSKGIPNTKIKKTHDLRCVIVNGSIEFCFVRIPTKCLIASICKGAKVINIIPPKSVLPVVKKIDLFVKKFGNRVYSIDLFFSNGKYYLIELNSKPGFGIGIEFGFPLKEKKLMQAIFKKIVLVKLKEINSLK